MLSLPKTIIGKRRWILLLLPLLVGYSVLMASIMDVYDGSGRARNPQRTFLRNDVDSVHPKSPFHQRGEQFDSSVTRDRGVLMCIHNGVLALGVSLIRELRCLGNRELIQVYHCGPAELSQESKDFLVRIDDRLELVDVCSDLMQRGSISERLTRRFRNWWIKPLAMYHTDVRHVMLMDVDDIFVEDPATLRDLELYKKTGTTFFYDRVHSNCGVYVNGKDGGIPYLKKLFATFNYTQFNVTGGNSPSQQALNSFAYNGKACHEMDSSLVLVDKERAGQTVMDIMFWFITKERFRFDFSFGDKETFWLSFEMAHVPYAFSPWGVSVVSSWPNADMKNHPDSLCGSILQYLPDSSTNPQVLYVNGKALLDPYPDGINFGSTIQRNNMFNALPTHMTPHLPRTELNKTASRAGRKVKMHQECLVGLGATPLPESFAGRLLRRRLHYLGAMAGVLGSLELCGTFSLPN
ncbi:hypothetical protein PF005_g27379 [Phytophthora fragariae]|uniref:Nucleotide-diphospho-sugar transferase domain-containing protein n=2 Tax=Phytophthora TaxID=4783 RepID=A0A6A3W419_9STRA|nr:hypothetical protein PF009_g27878 [Phytophthora fragariae]KAE9046849.1 hypothetical protein PR002_g1412 [Phytophthora rubi]KAE9050026.1 hypothetical protein PR001_g2778 [Phytophthora rubi]KAE9069731.1 hypothetical protein PF007_g27204 [Phytophthora fragariae]KAE9074271.1 hypothetical protein PF010_g24743 [Phytophthora fragariae]